ncbi:MAG: type II toxin-antitoxin system prevent-host-death family antitoxin [Pseudoxanthomonas sp.]
MPTLVNVRQAKAHFSRLLEQAHAGQEIILAKAGKPYARLMPLASEPGVGKRVPGALAGKIAFDDRLFFELISEEASAEWERPS